MVAQGQRSSVESPRSDPALGGILEAELVCSSRAKQIFSALENLPQEQGWNKHRVE